MNIRKLAAEIVEEINKTTSDYDAREIVEELIEKAFTKDAKEHKVSKRVKITTVK